MVIDISRLTVLKTFHEPTFDNVNPKTSLRTACDDAIIDVRQL